jgi:hypothetical protein
MHVTTDNAGAKDRKTPVNVELPHGLEIREVDEALLIYNDAGRWMSKG